MQRGIGLGPLETKGTIQPVRRSRDCSIISIRSTTYWWGSPFLEVREFHTVSLQCMDHGYIKRAGLGNGQGRGREDEETARTDLADMIIWRKREICFNVYIIPECI